MLVNLLNLALDLKIMFDGIMFLTLFVPKFSRIDLIYPFIGLEIRSGLVPRLLCIFFFLL